MTRKFFTMNYVIFFTSTSLLMAIVVVGNTSCNSTVELLAKIPNPEKSTNISWHSPVREFLFDKEVIFFSTFFYESNGHWIQILDKNKNKRECSIPLKLTYQIRRLSHAKFLVTEEHDHYYDRKNKAAKLVLVDTDSCKYDYIYDHYTPVNKILIFTSGNPDDERFTLVTYGKEACQGYEWCRLYFNPSYKKIESLDIGDWPCWPFDLRVEPVTKFDGNLFTVRFTDQSGTYRVRLYDISSNKTGPMYQELFNIPYYMKPPGILYCNEESSGATLYALYSFFRMKNDHVPKYYMKSSGLSFCWRSDREDELQNIAHCSQFREDGTLIFNKTIVYQEKMVFRHIETIPNGLVLISSKHCRDNSSECKRVQVAVITHEVESIERHCTMESDSTLEPLRNELLQVKHRSYNTDCINFYTIHFDFRINGSDGLIEVRYLCMNHDENLFKVFYVN